MAGPARWWTRELGESGAHFNWRRGLHKPDNVGGVLVVQAFQCSPVDTVVELMELGDQQGGCTRDGGDH